MDGKDVTVGQLVELIKRCSFLFQGDIRDPVIEKLLETINNENDHELEQVLRTESNQLERIRQTEIRGASLLHYACSRYVY